MSKNAERKAAATTPKAPQKKNPAMERAPIVMERYNLGHFWADVMMPEQAGATLDAFHAIIADVKKDADAPIISTGTKAEKVSPLKARYENDAEGKKAAEAFLRSDGGVFDLITTYIGEDPGRTFHVLNAVEDLAVKYLRDERDFHNGELSEGKPITSAAMMEKKNDVNTLRALFSVLAQQAVVLGKVDPDDSKVIALNSKGDPVSVLTGYRGVKATDDGSVSGRYAKVYLLTWTIDGEPIEEGARISNIVRLIWTGADRIGKNAKALCAMLDENVPGWQRGKVIATQSFETNGHKITVGPPAIVVEEDDDDDDDNADAE